MLHLSYGITGFYNSGENPPPRYTAEDIFKERCLKAAESIDAEMIAFHPPKLNTNFFEAVLDNGVKRIHILMNAYYPLIAFAASVEKEHITFYDEEELVDYFRGFEICEARDLNQLLKIQRQPEFDLLHDHDLNSAEMSQIMYWQPYTVGELVFNYWN